MSFGAEFKKDVKWAHKVLKAEFTAVSLETESERFTWDYSLLLLSFHNRLKQ